MDEGLRVEQWRVEDLDLAAAGALGAVQEAQDAVDSPLVRLQGPAARLGQLRHGWAGHPVARLLVVRGDGADLLATAETWYDHWDNPENCSIDVSARPGTSDAVLTALFEASQAAAHGDGRRLAYSAAWTDSPVDRWLAANGWEVGSRSAMRRIVVPDLDHDRVAAMLTDAEHHSPAYVLEPLPTPTPPELVEPMIGVHESMNDQPMDDLDATDEAWTPQRVHANDTAMIDRGLRVHRLLARRRDDGALAGYTAVVVDPDRPWHAEQEDTVVVEAHRGHRLGMRLKASMLQVLAAVEPDVREIDTWNAESNAHMIAVNDALGCVVVGRVVEVQRRL